MWLKWLGENKTDLIVSYKGSKYQCANTPWRWSGCALIGTCIIIIRWRAEHDINCWQEPSSRQRVVLMNDSLRQVMDRGFLQYYVLFGLKFETISYFSWVFCQWLYQFANSLSIRNSSLWGLSDSMYGISDILCVATPI